MVAVWRLFLFLPCTAVIPSLTEERPALPEMAVSGLMREWKQRREAMAAKRKERVLHLREREEYASGRVLPLPPSIVEPQR